MADNPTPEARVFHPRTRFQTLARRPGLYWFDLDAPDLRPQNLADGFEYVQRQLADSDLPAATLDEIARLGAGNFLVLKLLCQQIRTVLLTPEQVTAFLHRLATAGGQGQLGFIYAEFWQRLTERCALEEVELLLPLLDGGRRPRQPMAADAEVAGVIVQLDVAPAIAARGQLAPQKQVHAGAADADLGKGLEIADDASRRLG